VSPERCRGPLDQWYAGTISKTMTSSRGPAEKSSSGSASAGSPSVSRRTASLSPFDAQASPSSGSTTAQSWREKGVRLSLVNPLLYNKFGSH
jgi:hypothetical protein